MVTYILKSGKHYKIGKTTSLRDRMTSYDTHNPDYELLKTIDGDCEKYLHNYFVDYHYKLEWFSLPDNWEELLAQSDYIKQCKPSAIGVKKTKELNYKLYLTSKTTTTYNGFILTTTHAVRKGLITPTYPMLDRLTLISFGKYKDHRFENIMKSDTKYAKWFAKVYDGKISKDIILTLF